MVKILKSNIWSYIKSKFENNPNNIKMNGTPTAGTNDKIARADHTHPHDNTKADKNHNHDTATTNNPGFISAIDKLKLDNIESNANNYKHPTYTSKGLGLYKIEVDNTGHINQTGYVTINDLEAIGVPTSITEYKHPTYGALTGKPSANTTPLFGDEITISQVVSNNTGHVSQLIDRKIKIPDNEASNTKRGLMSSSDKIKLDSIEANSNKTTVDTRLSGNSNNPVTNTVITNALSGKADSNHTHNIGNIPGLPNALDAKSDTGHTHNDKSSVTEISSFQNAWAGNVKYMHKNGWTIIIFNLTNASARGYDDICSTGKSNDLGAYIYSFGTASGDYDTLIVRVTSAGKLQAKQLVAGATTYGHIIFPSS